MGSIYGSVPKFNDVTDQLTVTGAAGNGADKLDNASAIDIGTGPTDRNAQCVAIKSMTVRYQPEMIGDSELLVSAANLQLAMTDVNYRLLVVLDRQPNKAALTAALIWEDPSLFTSPLNLDNRKRIKILKEVRGRFHAAGATQVVYSGTAATPFYSKGAIVYQRKFWMKFKKLMLKKSRFIS